MTTLYLGFEVECGLETEAAISACDKSYFLRHEDFSCITLDQDVRGGCREIGREAAAGICTEATGCRITTYKVIVRLRSLHLCAFLIPGRGAAAAAEHEKTELAQSALENLFDVFPTQFLSRMPRG